MQAIGCVKRSRAWQLLYNRSMYEHCDRINVIRELLAVEHGYLELHLFSSLVLKAIIEFYVLHNFCNFLIFYFILLSYYYYYYY